MKVVEQQTYRGFKIPMAETIQLVPGINIPMVTVSRDSQIIALPLTVEDVMRLHMEDPVAANKELYDIAVKTIDAVCKKLGEFD